MEDSVKYIVHDSLAVVPLRATADYAPAFLCTRCDDVWSNEV